MDQLVKPHGKKKVLMPLLLSGKELTAERKRARATRIDSGTITTIHSAMNDQPVLDAYHHTDLRKTRAASQSIIPVDTGLARGVERILPVMAGRFTG